MHGQRATPQLCELAAQMYVHGVSTRHVEKVLRNCGLQPFSSTPVSRAAAETALRALVAWYRGTAPAFPRWLATNVPDGLGVFSQPAAYRVRLRTTNMLERGVLQETKRRTRTIRPFPDMGAVTRLVTATLMDIDEKWAAERRPYLQRMGENE